MNRAKRLGPPREAGLKGARVNREKSLAELAPLIKQAVELRRYCTYQVAADKLNARGFKTRQGHRITKQWLRQLLVRL